jgi:outer membrane receptor for Fe3+-dicitrate
MTSLEEDYVASEDIFASYAMGTWDIGALRIIGGVRVENTRFKAVGNQVDVAANGRSFTVTPRVANSSYTNVLPGLHLRYDAADDWVLRASANKTVSRPSFGDVSPRVGYSGDEEVRLGNRSWIRTSRRTSTCRWRSTSAAAASFRWACSTSRSTATSWKPCVPTIRPTAAST